MNIRINLGCGADYKPGWINIDSRESYKSELNKDFTELEYLEGTVDEILASHSFSYLTYDEAIKMINKCYKWLKVGGRVEIRVPDFVELVAGVHFYREEQRDGFKGWRAINIGIFGFIEDGPYPMRSVWCKEDLVEQLGDIGFSEVKVLLPRDNFELRVEAIK